MNTLFTISQNKTMSQCKFILGILLIFILHSCHKSRIPDVYFPGVVIIKANEDFPNGLIQALDVFSEEEGIEASSRGIIYTYETDQVFNLNDTVLFKIKECKNLNILKACHAIKPDSFKLEDHALYFDSLGFASLKQIYDMKSLYKINFHLADSHREGPKHKKRHLKPPKVLVSIYEPWVGGDPNYKEIELIDPENPTEEPERAYIYDPNNIDTGPENVYFFSIREGVRPDLPDTLKVYNVSRTHDHIIE